MPRRQTTQTGTLHKTSLAVPAETWKALRIAAIEDGEQVQVIITRLVEAYLKDRARRKGGKVR